MATKMYTLNGKQVEVSGTYVLYKVKYYDTDDDRHYISHIAASSHEQATELAKVCYSDDQVDLRGVWFERSLDAVAIEQD